MPLYQGATQDNPLDALVVSDEIKSYIAAMLGYHFQLSDLHL